jgi:hypothetical protein
MNRSSHTEYSAALAKLESTLLGGSRSMSDLAWEYLFACRKPPSYVPYKGTYVPYDGTFGAPDQGQTLDV